MTWEREMNKVKCAIALAFFSLTAAGCASGPHYTRSDNPCVNSRLTNGKQYGAYDPTGQIALSGAEMYCSYGREFDGTPNPTEGVGANTSGWNCPSDGSIC